MAHTGIALLDELKAFIMAEKMLHPFEKQSTQTMLTLIAIRTRIQAIQKQPELHEALMYRYNLPCESMEEAVFKHNGTGERKQMGTCGNSACPLFQHAVELGRWEPTDECRVENRNLMALLSR
jgi:hypothetical protein